MFQFGFTPFWAKKKMYVVNARSEGDYNKENDPLYTGAKGIITKASKSKIQMTKLIYFASISIMDAIWFCPMSAMAKNPNDDTIKDMDAVLTTLALSSSLLKKRKKAVSIPYAKITLNNTKYEKITDTLPYSEGFAKTASLVYNGTNKKLNILGNTVASP